MKPPDYSTSMLATRSRLGLPPLNKRRRSGSWSFRLTCLAIILGHALLGLAAWVFNR